MKSIRYYKKISQLLAFTAFTVLFVACKEEKTVVEENIFTADVIVYGGTSAAVTTAVQAKQMGKSVLVVSPDKHLGGLSSSGLGYTDTGNKEVIGGLAREFYQKIYQYYQKDETWQWQKKEEYGNVGQGTPAIDGTNRTMWIFEPHVAEQVFEDFITENEITVYREEFLDRSNGVTLTDGKITRIETLSGKKFEGKVFIDATYEGDLMAAAGVSYTVGREARETYDEEWNGVQVGILHHQHHFGDMNISRIKFPAIAAAGWFMGCLLKILENVGRQMKGTGL